MAVTVEQLRELRELGAKRVEFTTKGEIRAIDFFGEEPEEPPAAEGVAVKVIDQHPEIPPGYHEAFNTLLRKPKPETKAQ